MVKNNNTHYCIIIPFSKSESAEQVAHELKEQGWIGHIAELTENAYNRIKKEEIK